MARLTTDKRKSIMQQIREYESRTDHTETEKAVYAYNWETIAEDHFTKLRLDLDHIGNLALLDVLISEVRTGSRLTTGDYMEHYDQQQLLCIEQEIKDVFCSLQYLQGLIDEENERRTTVNSSKVIPMRRAKTC